MLKMSTDEKKRELVLPPGTYAYMQDQTKGLIRVHTGPTVVNQTNQESPVVYDPESGTFKRVSSIEEALKKSVIAPEGFYVVLLNPAREKASEHPSESSVQSPPDLFIGRKINIPGPCAFALWPGQAAQHVRGHHLKSNQYLTVRVYNEEEARKNWNSAVVKPATLPEGATRTREQINPADLTVGKQFIIRGDEVSFYIPPTGVSVVPENGVYVRDALTLERLEYAILIDEDGNKRYERGPQVVFPAPTETFLLAKNDRGQLTKKWQAIELNPIQGLHIKVISDYTENGKQFTTGEELFITGKETPIYFPREEHSLIVYDGKAKAFATAVPAGEARYVMNRMTGEITMVTGPAMLLPDPRSQVIVRRVLTDKQCSTWYPGNTEALEYNRTLRAVLPTVPTTRSGAISEGDYERFANSPPTKGSGGGVKTKSLAAVEASAVMPASNVG